MSEQQLEQETEAAVSEQPEVESQEQESEQKMVPLSAMLATRKKLQEMEEMRNQERARAELYQQQFLRAKEAEPEAEDDSTAIVEKQHLRETAAATKRDILETLYQDMNPEAVKQINKYLKPILEQKPWLAATVDTAQNRYARAYEIVKDYLHLVEEKQPVKTSSNVDGKKIIQNAQKPRSPHEIGKSAQPGGTEYLKSIQGKTEFREYRQKVLRGEA
jgi:hypothetical protein